MTSIPDSTAAYNLVVICTSEHEDTSYLASALINYKVVSPPPPSQQTLRLFLQDQFTISRNKRTLQHFQNASEADIDG